MPLLICHSLHVTPIMPLPTQQFSHLMPLLICHSSQTIPHMPLLKCHSIYATPQTQVLNFILWFVWRRLSAMLALSIYYFSKLNLSSRNYIGGFRLCVGILGHCIFQGKRYEHGEEVNRKRCTNTTCICDVSSTIVLWWSEFSKGLLFRPTSLKLVNCR